jgi:hypothetical protein
VTLIASRVTKMDAADAVAAFARREEGQTMAE